MSLRRTLAIAQKEFRHLMNDRRLLFLVLLSPAFLLLTLSYVFSFDVKWVTLAVMDLDKSPFSRRYLAYLTSDGELTVSAYPTDYLEIEALLKRGEVDVALIMPPHFGEEAMRGESPPLQALADGIDPISASQALGTLSARTLAFASGTTLGSPLEVRSRAWYNQGLKSLVSMVPGLLAVVSCVPALAVALAMAREKEMGTLERLIVTPLRGAEYITGKILAYVACGLVSVVLAFSIAAFWFRVPFRGSFPLFLILAADYFLASMGLSLLASHFVASQQTAFVIVLFLFFVPSFFVAGLILPVDTKSLSAQAIAYSLPTTHFIALCRDLFLKGVGLASLWRPASILAGMGSLSLALSTILFKKRLE